MNLYYIDPNFNWFLLNFGYFFDRTFNSVLTKNSGLKAPELKQRFKTELKVRRNITEFEACEQWIISIFFILNIF